MGRCSCCLVLLTLVVIVVLDGILFAGLIGKFDTRHKMVTTTDISSIEDNLSTFWCDGVTLESSLPFDAYQLPSFPMVENGKYKESSRNTSLSLTRYEFVMYKVYLLPESSIKISICSSEPMAMLSIFTSEDNANECLKQRKGLDSGESDIDDFVCSKHAASSQIMVESDCDSPDWRWWKNRKEGMDVANVKAYEEQQYYVLIQNFYYRGLNNIKMQINLSRTSYDVSESHQSCKASKKCYLGFNFMSASSVVLEMLPSKTNEPFIQTSLFYRCDLNEIILIAVYIVFPVILFMITCCVYCCWCRKPKQRERMYVKTNPKFDTESLLTSVDMNSDDNSVFKSDIEPRRYGSTSTSEAKAFNYNFLPQTMAPPPREQDNGTATAPVYYAYVPPPAYNSTGPNNMNVPPSNQHFPQFPQSKPQEPAPPYSY